MTEDRGQSWRPFGIDADRTSPFEVETDREGQFGFRLLIHDEAGNSARPPQPGETPDLAVVVDMTPPKVHLEAAELARDQPNAVVVKWQATDRYLRDRTGKNQLRAPAKRSLVDRGVESRKLRTI